MLTLRSQFSRLDAPDRWASLPVPFFARLPRQRQTANHKDLKMNDMIGELTPPSRLMLTPGPSCVDPRVYRAMAAPLVGHVDPWFTEMMGDVQYLLRRVFQTENRITFPISASGSGGIEAAVQ